MSSTGPAVVATVASEFIGVRLRKAATSPRCRSRSTSAICRPVSPASWNARLTASVVAPSPPRAPHTVTTVPARPGLDHGAHHRQADVARCGERDQPRHLLGDLLQELNAGTRVDSELDDEDT